jgi:tetratricopeptide (TPR) repeat protein
VTDQPSRRNLAANTWSEEYKKDFEEGNGAPDPATIEGQLVERIVDKIVRQLAPTKEEVGVLLPEGSLKDLNNLAKRRLWGNYLEAIELLPAKPTPKDESYRQYALGVANEALAYDAEDVDAALRYLQEASSHYNQALSSNPEEKYFARAFDGWAASIQGKRNMSAPLERVQTSLVKYQKLKDFRDAPQAQIAASAAASKGLDGTPVDPDLLDNAGLISMVQAGLSDDIVINAIKTTEKTSFDLSPKGLIQLSQANVSEKVIQTLQGLTQKKPAKKK